ncbi:MAG: serine hydrolase [Candidatus Heimdallarchaeaceae archaeon]
MKKEDLWGKIEQKIIYLMQKAKIPGLSLAVIKDQEIIYAKGFGNRNIAKNLPATKDTLFGIGSCTKIFTSLAILQLAEQGRLCINDPVSKYLPFKVGRTPDSIQIRHLMSHSSGIPNLGSASILIRRHSQFEETWVPFATKEEFYHFINGAKKEVVDEPGKRFFYFNAGYTLLGEIIETVSGLKYEEYIKKFILQPLQMERSTYLMEEFYKDNNKMIAYTIEKDKPVEKEHPFNQFIYAAGGLLSSVNELSHFLIMLLNEGSYLDQKIISSESLNEMFSIQINTPEGFFGKSGYGYGVSINEDFLGVKLIAHSGSTGLSSAYFALIPDHNIGVVTAANVGNGRGSLIAQTILCMLMDSNPEEKIPFFHIQTRMEQLCGEYASYKNLNTMKVFVENGLLFMENSFGETTIKNALIPEDPKLLHNEFYVYSFGSKTPVSFEIKEDGSIDAFVERNCFHKIK